MENSDVSLSLDIRLEAASYLKERGQSFLALAVRVPRLRGVAMADGSQLGYFQHVGANLLFETLPVLKKSFIGYTTLVRPRLVGDCYKTYCDSKYPGA